MSNTRAEITLEWESGLTEDAIKSMLRSQFAGQYETVDIDVQQE